MALTLIPRSNIELDVFCLEHRTYRSHTCPKADHSSRTVAVCDICSASIEKKANEDDKDSLSRHEKSGTCDPLKKRKPRCPVPRCKEILTFSNQSACKVCNVKVCLKHRFPSDHSCRMTKLAARTGLECKEKKQRIPVFADGGWIRFNTSTDTEDMDIKARCFVKDDNDMGYSKGRCKRGRKQRTAFLQSPRNTCSHTSY
ncbi:Zinc finger AN1 domain-containing stress-associated protein 12 [Dendrobium catenatum]|uniref:Zinc finger AN1 domain-containing stress-associated protein 12 n=1 Tax=Dendrobium catenatum TaxID=906689 RepID=A0A2I0XCG9_9ASPA|nr:Zinc finger AN1 domain-containing stress-associated protein 12 [Dendrobium catenatum]